jgi:hypothetical protein
MYINLAKASEAFRIAALISKILLVILNTLRFLRNISGKIGASHIKIALTYTREGRRKHDGGGDMGAIGKTLGIAGLVLALKGSYHLGKTAAGDSRYDIRRRDGVAYLVDRTRQEEARLDEGKPLDDQPSLCAGQVSKRERKVGVDGYLETAAEYLRRSLE